MRLARGSQFLIAELVNFARDFDAGASTILARLEFIAVQNLRDSEIPASVTARAKSRQQGVATPRRRRAAGSLRGGSGAWGRTMRIVKERFAATIGAPLSRMGWLNYYQEVLRFPRMEFARLIVACPGRHGGSDREAQRRQAGRSRRISRPRLTFIDP